MPGAALRAETYKQLFELKQKHPRVFKLGRNTQFFENEDPDAKTHGFKIYYHHYHILTVWDDDTVSFNLCGFNTRSTLDRVNTFILPKHRVRSMSWVPFLDGEFIDRFTWHEVSI